VLDADNPLVGITVGLYDPRDSTDLADNRFPLGHPPRFKQFLHPRKTRSNIAASGNAAGVEGAQGQLRSWLANRLRRHNANRRTQGHFHAPAQVHAITGGADAVDQLAGQRRAHFHLVNASVGDLAHVGVVEERLSL